MSGADAKNLESHLALVRRRTGLNSLLRAAGMAVIAAAGAVLAATAAERLLAVPLVSRWTLGGTGVLVAAYAAWAWRRGRPNRLAAAEWIDERLALRERLSTALAVADSADPFAVAVRQEAYARAEGLKVAPHFPVLLTRRWAWALGLVVAATLAYLYLPPYDMLGRREDERLAQLQERKRQDAEDVARRTAARVEPLLRDLDVPDLAAEAAQLAQFPPAAAPEDIRREAIRRLGDLADRLRESKAGERADAAETLKQMMRQLRSPGSEVSRVMARAMARGEFAKAAEAARKLAEQMQRGEMSAEQKAQLAAALKSLAEQAQRLAADKKALEDALQRAGAPRDLAGANADDLRKKLQEMGLDEKTIKELMQKAQACQQAGAQCQGLAQALAGAATGLSGGAGGAAELGDLAQRLSDMEALRQQLAMMGAALDEMEKGQELLGQAQLARLGEMGAFSTEGLGEPGAGSGQRGQGSGPVGSDTDGATGTFGTRVQNPSGSSEPIIATWTTYEEQLKGESRARVQETARTARDRAAEAVSENRIPSRYHGAVKQYFGDLNLPGGSDAPSIDLTKPVPESPPR